MIHDATCPLPRGKCLVFCTSEAEMQEHAQHRAMHHALDRPCLLHAGGLPGSHLCVTSGAQMLSPDIPER